MTLLQSPLRPVLRSPVYSPLVGKYGGGPAYDPAALALFARFTTPPTDERKGVINTLIVSLKDAGVWSKLDALYVTAAHDEQAGQRNWISSAYNLTTVSGPAFTADRGYTGNVGAGSHLKTGYNPTTAASLAQLNSLALGVWIGTDVLGSGIDIGGRTSSTVANAFVNSRDTGNVAVVRANENASLSVPVSTSVGHTIVSRRASNVKDAYKNGGLLNSSVIASAALCNAEIYILALNTGGTAGNFSSRRVNAAHIGGALDPEQARALTKALNAYMAAVGAEAVTVDSAMRGVWTWFNDPRAISIDEHLVIGAISSSGDVLAYDTSASERMKIVDPLFQRDDHDNPAMAVRADGRILACYSKHGDPSIYAAASTNVGDATSWQSPVNLDSQLGQSNYAYANLFRLASGRFYLFHRATNAVTGDWSWHYSYTDDPSGVAGWVTSVQLSGSARPYHKFRQNSGDRIDAIVNDGHPNATANNATYHFYLKETAGSITFHKSDGTDITASLPFAGADLTVVDDGLSNGRTWVHDLTIDAGLPVAVYAAFPGATDTVADDHRYRQARWDGASWTSEEICAAGGDLYNIVSSPEPFYSGGVISDPENPDVVYCSRQVDGSGVVDNTGTHQLYKAERVSAGNWTLTQLTTGANKKFRPYLPEGSRTLLYLDGIYASYASFAPEIIEVAL